MNTTKSELKAVQYTLPVYWASYLINNDASGISESDKAEADAFLLKERLPAPCDVSEESHFSSYNDAFTGLGCDVAEYTFLIAI